MSEENDDDLVKKIRNVNTIIGQYLGDLDAAKEDGNKKSIIEPASSKIQEIKKALLSTPEKLNCWQIFNQKFSVLIFILLVLVIAFVALIISSEHPPALSLLRLEPDRELGYLMTFLAFVVALASYLASVSREIVKALSGGKTKVEKYKLKSNMRNLVVAEMTLVIIGLGTVYRLIFGTHVFTFYKNPFSLDTFLLSYLACVLVYMAMLHALIWWATHPWSFKSKDD